MFCHGIQCASGWHSCSHVQSDAQAPRDLQGLTVSAGKIWMGPIETKKDLLWDYFIVLGTRIYCLVWVGFRCCCKFQMKISQHFPSHFALLYFLSFVFISRFCFILNSDKFRKPYFKKQTNNLGKHLYFTNFPIAYSSHFKIWLHLTNFTWKYRVSFSISLGFFCFVFLFFHSQETD